MRKRGQSRTPEPLDKRQSGACDLDQETQARSRDGPDRSGGGLRRSRYGHGQAIAPAAGQRRRRGSDATGAWELRLYVAGQSQHSLAAIANLRRLCEAYLRGRYRIELVDLLANPQLSRADHIVAVPTLVRTLPRPIRKIVGDLSDTGHALVGLQLRPAS